jgi:hypothetical protein
LDLTSALEGQSVLSHYSAWWIWPTPNLDLNLPRGVIQVFFARPGDVNHNPWFQIWFYDAGSKAP